MSIRHVTGLAVAPSSFSLQAGEQNFKFWVPGNTF